MVASGHASPRYCSVSRACLDNTVCLQCITQGTFTRTGMPPSHTGSAKSIEVVIQMSNHTMHKDGTGASACTSSDAEPNYIMGKRGHHQPQWQNVNRRYEFLQAKRPKCIQWGT